MVKSGRLAISGLLALALVASACQYTPQIKEPTFSPADSTVVAADGQVLTILHSAENRTPVPLSRISPTLQRSVVAIEDSRYFEHTGIDPRALVRAITRDAQAGDAVEGGSTITQQYVRNVILDDRDKTFSRKAREAVLAIELERKYSKRQILERYLNTVYFGDGAYGVQAAARHYFARDAADLDLAQSALLAGIIRSPEGYNPYLHPAEALARRDVVLRRMLSLNRAGLEAVDRARSEPLGVVAKSTPASDLRYPGGHFVERVKQFVLTDHHFGATPQARRRALYQGGLRIETTLDPKLQADAESAVAKVLTRVGRDPSAAVVSVDPTNGHVLAYVGGRDFFGSAPDAEFDLAGQGVRQPGSSFKPFVLAAALQSGIPLTRTYNAPGSIVLKLPDAEPWRVKNYDGGGGGRENLVDATVNSVNTVYAQLILDVGPQKVVDLAAQLGVRTPLPAYPSAALGADGVTVLDMASAYATFAADGVRSDPVFVTRVTRADGSIVYTAPVTRTRVITANLARTVTGVLQQVVQRGTGVKARLDRPVAGKTGTAESWHDAWFVGYTPGVSTAVWVGYPASSKSMVPPTTPITVTGGTWPAQIWHEDEAAALAGTPVVPFPVPVAEAPTPTTTAPARAFPDVVGLRAEAAQEVLAAAGLKVTVASRASRDYPPGFVVAQSPPGGSRIRRTNAVTISVANGPPASVVVPAVSGKYADEAAAALRAVALAPSVVVQRAPAGTTVPAGRVWSSDPAAGTLLDAGSTVVVQVSPADPTTTAAPAAGTTAPPTVSASQPVSAPPG
ncbi:MAG: penicillin-binding protein family [Actinomycetia bacterium]|nr:penicillin-binding protein family [Actinomycetes bacterium]